MANDLTDLGRAEAGAAVASLALSDERLAEFFLVLLAAAHRQRGGTAETWRREAEGAWQRSEPK